MGAVQVISIMLFTCFYASHLIKMILLRWQGVSGDLLGRGRKPFRGKGFEVFSKIVTYDEAAGQFINVFFSKYLPGFTANSPGQIVGLVFMTGGCAFFHVAVITM